jgi:threonine dehydrogenase-like Zn-dependent dehydrogenase
MKALYLDHRPILRDDLPEPQPGPDEALLRVRLAGVCATDLALTRGYAGGFRGVLGHELVAEILSAPAAPDRAGQRVTAEINIPCGHCGDCAAGRPSHCRQREVIGIRGRDGAFAEYLRVPLANLHPVPDPVSDEAAVFTEPLAAALQVQQQLAVRPGQRVLVVGAGRLGQLIARVLRLTGCDLSVVARHARQRDLLAAAGVPWLGEDAVPGAWADVVVEASGAPGGFALARHAVRPRGTLCLKSTYEGALRIDLSALVVDEISVVGSRCGPFPAALRLLAQGLVDPTPLIDARLPLKRAVEALDRAARPGTMKVLIDCRAAGAPAGG